jgi:hypothetical protein
MGADVQPANVFFHNDFSIFFEICPDLCTQMGISCWPECGIVYVNVAFWIQRSYISRNSLFNLLQKKNMAGTFYRSMPFWHIRHIYVSGGSRGVSP